MTADYREMNKIRVCFLLGSLAIGGTQKNVVNILKTIDRDAFEPRLVCFFGGWGAFEKEIKRQGVPVLILDHWRLFDIRVYLKMIRFIKGSNILQCFGYPTIYFGVFLGKIAGVKRIIVAVQDQDVWKKWYHILLDKLIRPFIDLYIADGKITEQYAIAQQHMRRDKIITIYDGADMDTLLPQKTRGETRAQLGLTTDGQIVCVICRLDDKKKGVSYFLKAIPPLAKDFPNTQFLVVGDGENRRELEELAQQLKISHQVVFTGFRSDVADILNIVDIFVIPSLWESVPKTLVDAMATGKPIVSTNIGDIPEMVTDGKSAILVGPKDPTALSGAIRLLLQNKALRDNLGENAFAAAEEKGLTLTRSTRILERHYTDIDQTAVPFTAKLLRPIYLVVLTPCVMVIFLALMAAAVIKKILLRDTK